MNSSTILLVDDDEVLGQVLGRVLTRQGYTVVQAGSASSALQKARETRPQLGLLDLCLPDGDGVELAEQLEREVGPIPLILMTAYPLRLRDHPELARQFCRVLTKPLNLEELRQTVDSVLKAPAAGLAAAPVAAGPAGLSAETLPPPAAPLHHPNPVGIPVEARPTPEVYSQPASPSRRKVLVPALVGVAVLAAGLFLILPVLGVPGIPNLLALVIHKPEGPGGGESKPVVNPLPDNPDVFDVDAQVLAALQILERPEDSGSSQPRVQVYPIKDEAEPRKLEMAGSLAFDPNTLGRVQARFAGEVISLGKNENGREASTSSADRARPLKYGDFVKEGQLLAVVWSKDLGEKKSELVDAMSLLDTDQQTLTKLEKAYNEGTIAEALVRQARRNVAADIIARNRAEATLRVWKLPSKEIEALEAEARRIISKHEARDPKTEQDRWARVEVKAPFDGVLVEKNVTRGQMVDPTVDLYKVASLDQLAVFANAYEEDIRQLNTLRKRYRGARIPWTVYLSSDPQHRPLETEGIEQIGLIVDPTQHTDLVMGHVSNPWDRDHPDGKYRAGQFVTCVVSIPAPEGVVSVPISALAEDGKESVLFVQPDPNRLRLEMRRVKVVDRFHETAYVASKLTPEEIKKGLRPVKPGDRVVRAGPLQLQAALEDARGKAPAN